MNKYLEMIEGLVTSATEGMTEEQLTFHHAGKWSTAQILEHLSKTYTGTRRGFEKALAANRSLATTSTARQLFVRFLLIGLGYFPRGRKSPERVAPSGNWTGEHAVKTIHQELANLMEAQAKVEKTFSRMKFLDHPVLGPLTPEQWARFHYVHARHHMKQIATLRQQTATIRSASA